MSLDSWTGANTNTSFNGNLTSLSSEAAMDTWLWRLMQKEKNRDMIARLEDNLHSFVLNDKEPSLTFPPRSAFHRRVCYAVARRYGLDHRLEAGESSPGAQTDESSGESVRLVLIKTPYSAPPSDRLADFANGPPPVSSGASSTPDLPIMASCLPSPCPPTPVVPVSIIDGEAPASRPATFLRRPRTADGKTLRTPLVNGAQSLLANGSATLKRITEEDYQKARARIFKMTDSSPEMNSLAQTEAESGVVCEDSRSVIQNGGGVAKGPVEGSRGFERRRNRRGGTGNGSSPNTVTGSVSGSDSRFVRRSNSSAGERDDSSRAIPEGTGVRIVRPMLPVPRASKDNGRVGNGLGGNGGGQISGTASLATAGRRYASEGNLGDLQDPDFDRSYIKWARRESISPTNAPQGNGLGFPMYPAHMIYSYAGTQAMAHHALHGGPLGLRSSPGLTTGLPHHAAAGLGHFHPGALLHAGNGGMFGPIPQAQRPGAGQAVLSNDFAVHSTGMGVTCSASDCAETPNLGRGITPNTVSTQSVTNSPNSSYDISSINDGIGLRMRAVVSQPQHSMMSWPPQSVPMTIRTPPAPAYGLDSTVDFPPLR